MIRILGSLLFTAFVFCLISMLVIKTKAVQDWERRVDKDSNDMLWLVFVAVILASVASGIAFYNTLALFS